MRDNVWAAGQDRRDNVWAAGQGRRDNVWTAGLGRHNELPGPDKGDRQARAAAEDD